MHFAIVCDCVIKVKPGCISMTMEIMRKKHGILNESICACSIVFISFHPSCSPQQSVCLAESHEPPELVQVFQVGKVSWAHLDEVFFGPEHDRHKTDTTDLGESRGIPGNPSLVIPMIPKPNIPNIPSNQNTSKQRAAPWRQSVDGPSHGSHPGRCAQLPAHFEVHPVSLQILCRFCNLETLSASNLL